MAYTDYLDTVQKIYIAFYQRPADPDGLLYWAAKLDAANGNLNEIIDSFANSDEAKEVYGEINEDTIGDVIDNIYQAAFDRLPDEAGKQFYIEGFKEGKFTAGSIVVDVLAGAQGEDVVTLENKLVSAMNFTKAIDPELDGKNLLATYAGPEDAQKAREYLKEVGFSPATIMDEAEAKTFVVANIADEGDPIKVEEGTEDYQRTLTPEIETYTGTAADDQIDAITQFNPQAGNYVDTLNSGDSVDGGEGFDTLNAVTSSATIIPTLTSIEKINWTSYSFATFDMIKSDTSLQEMVIDGPVRTVTVNNLKNVPDFVIKNDVGGNSVNLAFTDSALSGTETLNVTLENVNLTTLDIDAPTQSIETLHLNSTVAPNSIGEIGDGWTDALANTSEVTLEGDAALYIGLDTKGQNVLGVNGLNRLTALDKIDASKMTAEAYLDVSTLARDLDIVTGSGDDYIDMGTNLTTKDKVDLGEGTNTLAITGSANPASGSYDVKNINTLKVTTAGATIVNAEAFGGNVDTIKAVSAANGDSITANNLANASKVEVQDASTTAINAMAAATFNLKNTSATDDSIDITVRGNDSNVDADGDNINEFTVAALTANGVENVTINSTSTGIAPIENKITTLNTNAVETLTLTGDTDLTIGNNIAAKKVDGSAMTAGVDITVLGKAVTGGAQEVVTGSGNDVVKIAFANTDENVKIDTQDGNDTLAFTDAGAITLTGVTNSAKIANFSNFENVTLTTGGASLVIDDATLNIFNNQTMNFVSGDLNNALDASGVVNSNATINVDVTKMTTAANTFKYTMSNGHNTYTGGAGVDTVEVKNVNYLESNDVISGGAGLTDKFIINNVDTATGGTPDAYTYTADSLSAISGFETLAIQEQAAVNANDVSLTLSNTFVANNINTTNSTLVVDGSAVVTDKLTIDGSEVTSAYKLQITGGSATDTITGGAGDDTIKGGLSKDTIDLSSGGKDKVVVDGVVGSADVISGFTLHGPAATADTGMDQLDVSGIAGIVITDANGDNIADNYAERDTSAGAAAFVDNGITVVTGKGYSDIANVFTATDITLAANDEGLIVFYNTSTLKTEVYYFKDADGGADYDAGEAVLYDQLADITLDDLSNFAADNFIV